MKRTTIFADQALLDAMHAIAQHEQTSLSAAIRTALEEYVARRQGKRTLPSFTAVGRSGRHDIAENAKSSLWTDPHAKRKQ